MKEVISRIKAPFNKYLAGWRGTLVQGILIVLLLLGLRAWQQQGVIHGQALPVNGVLLSAQTVDWQSYRGRPMLLHFWASWCAICRLEEDSINAISKDHAVLTIASWSDNTAQYIQQQQLGFDVLDDVEGKWAQTYGLKAVPATFVIDAEGQIRFVEIGYSSEWGLRLRLWWLGL